MILRTSRGPRFASGRPLRHLAAVMVLSICWLGSVSGSEPRTRELRLGYFPNITHAQALYAKATGAFDQIGARIRWTAFNAGPTAIESLLTDSIDAAFVGPGPTLNGYLKSRGEKFVVVAGSASGGAGLVIRPDSGIQNTGDFGGKIIATPQMGNSQDIAARVWLAAHGYELRERGGNVSLIPLSNADQLTMFRKKQIDGAWTVEPWLSRLEIEGRGRLFLDEASLWPGGRYVTTHLVMSRVYLASNPAVVRRLLAALVEVTERINADKPGVLKLLNEQMRRDTGHELKPEVLQKAISRVEFTWDPLSASLAGLADKAYRIHFFRTPPALEGLYSLTLLNDVLRTRDSAPVQGPVPGPVPRSADGGRRGELQSKAAAFNADSGSDWGENSRRNLAMVLPLLLWRRGLGRGGHLSLGFMGRRPGFRWVDEEAVLSARAHGQPISGGGLTQPGSLGAGTSEPA